MAMTLAQGWRRHAWGLYIPFSHAASRGMNGNAVPLTAHESVRDCAQPSDLQLVKECMGNTLQEENDDSLQRSLPSTQLLRVQQQS